MAQNKNQHQDSHQRETRYDKFIFFAKFIRQDEQNMCYVSEICAEEISVFTLVTKKCEK